MSGKTPFELNPSYPDSLDNLNLPIAWKKGSRSCTKDPTSNFVSNKNLSSSFCTFISQISSVEIPKHVQDALNVLEWKEAIFEMMRALEKN